MKKVFLVILCLSVLVCGQVIEIIGSGAVNNILRARTGDVVFTEIMADPLPAVSLPGEEYLEIYNRSPNTYNLEGWKLVADDQQAIFPPMEIDPGEFMILCSYSDTSLFSPFGKTLGFKPFPVLINDGRILTLMDSLGNLIAGIEYSSAWYGNALKEDGGWSLEMIDTGFPFCFEGNWEASSSRKGGTPGNANSSSRSNPDNFFSGAINLFLIDSVNITVVFNEPVFSLSGNIPEITPGEIRIISASPIDPLCRRYNLILDKDMKRGEVYTLNIPESVTDFAGNRASGDGLRFGIPEPVGRGDIVFNELLFNPLPEDPDYIELYNLSEKVIDASELFLASVDDESGKTSTAKQVTAEQRCILPGDFFAVTNDPEKVASGYPASVREKIFKSTSLPSMPDDRGHLLLLNRQMDLIDVVIYNEKMHFSLLADNEGISLEKIRTDLSSDESMNWHSASESSGWGTPGAENSVSGGELPVADEVVFSSAKISPDNDGFEDVLVIDINGNGLGNTVSVSVFDETGSLVNKVAENYFAGSGASLVWDGTEDDGSLVTSGIYIVLIELFDDRGKTKRWKKVCAVVR